MINKLKSDFKRIFSMEGEEEHSEELFAEASSSFLECWEDSVVYSRVTCIGILSLTLMTYETVSVT